MKTLLDQEVKNIWQQMCAQLQQQVSVANYNAWILSNPITHITYTSETSAVVVVTSPTAFHATNFKKNFHDMLTQTLLAILEKECDIEYHIGTPRKIIPTSAQTSSHTMSSIRDIASTSDLEKNNTTPSSPTFPTNNTASPRVEDLFSEQTLASATIDREQFLAQKIGLRKDYVFETFAVSTTNEMAHAAATAVSNHPGSSYNPLFLYGGVGVGKTHLMHAIGHNILHNNLNSKIIYCSGEEFTNEIVQAIQSKKATQFKFKFRSADVLLIDDVQFIAGKNAVQEEFFHTFNALIQQSKQVVLTSDRPPHEIRLLEDRLRSRFEAGLMIDIGQPSFELRTAILLIKSRANHISIPIDLAKLIASKVDSARKIEGIITSIRSEVELKRRPISEDLINDILRTETADQKQRIRVKPHDVIKTVANHFKLKQTELKGKKRNKEIVSARHITMYILKKELDMPLVEIGRWFARDHTSVIHAVRKIETDLLQDPEVQQDVSALHTTLTAISR